jgi:putative FmdB family regulatory protein
MPLYEYHCKPCILTFEALIKSAGEPAHCLRCNHIDVHKLLSVPATAQATRGRPGVLPESVGTGGPASFGCERPQCGSGMCAGLE